MGGVVPDNPTAFWTAAAVLVGFAAWMFRIDRGITAVKHIGESLLALTKRVESLEKDRVDHAERIATIEGWHARKDDREPPRRQRG